MKAQETTVRHQRGRMPKQSKPRRGWLIALGGTVALVLIGVLVSFSMAKETPKTTTPTTAAQPGGHFMDPNDMRSVRVAGKNEPMVLDKGGADIAVVTLLEGEIPPEATTATVQTDEECAPDTAGWSHCRNRIVLDDGSRAVVQHHHKLAEVGCFTPGQVIKFV